MGFKKEGGNNNEEIVYGSSSYLNRLGGRGLVW